MAVGAQGNGAPEDVAAEAAGFLALMERETGRPRAPRLQEVERQLGRHGTYTHTPEELEHGARVAWRNSARCIGRHHWNALEVRDKRHLDDPAAIFEACVDHIRLSTHDGRIRPLITVFGPARPGRPHWRIWNPQLIRYAGWRQPDGSILGDPLHAGLTQAVCELGWKGGTGGRFDLLPLVIQRSDQRPHLFDLPRGVVLEVALTHPELAWFEDLRLRWHALPAISDMRLEIGGVCYPCAPFSGWYMGTEIGARNLSDERRYNLLPEIAGRLGLDTSRSSTLWKDRALVELNRAVLHSYRARGVAIIDHHTAAKQFTFHERREGELGRAVPGDQIWLVPPMSASTMRVFHHPPFPDLDLRPNFYYQPKPWTAAASGLGRAGPHRLQAVS
jgi:nitric-oxide synthase